MIAHIENGAKKYDDFNEALAATKDKPTMDIIEYLVDNENAPDLIYYFGKNVDEYQALRKRQGRAVDRALAKLEAKITSSTDTTASKAPAPIKPVGAKSAPETSLKSEMDTDEWLKKRRKQVFGR